MTDTTADSPQVLVWTEGSLGRIRLNRPRTINALTLEMLQIFDDALTSFEADPDITAIALDGAGERGLCSGADVRAIRSAVLEGGAVAASRFWTTEYALNARISELSLPLIAFMDGIVMGGGVGVSAHGQIRVTTPTTRLAMPETGIGLFPDVGAMFILSRAPGELGTHMALTGLPVSGADAVHAGFADAIIPAGTWPDLLAAAARDPHSALAAVGAEVSPQPELTGADWIAECYAGDDPVAILDRLENSNEPAARAAAETIASRSPLSIVVTLAALRRAAALPNLRSVLDQDLRIANAFMADSDFLEGVRAVLVDRGDSPKWQHSHVSEVDPAPIAALLNS